MKTDLFILKKYVRIFWLTALFLGWLPFTGLAATYYISPAGNDSTGDGSVANPWRSLRFATQNVLNPGDIIFVMPGTYLETEQLFLQAGVSLTGDSTNIPVIQSTVTDIFKELLSLKSPEGTDGNQHISNLKFDGQNLSTFWAIWVAGRSNVSIYNCSIENFRDRGVIFSARSDFYEQPPDSLYSTGNQFFNNIINNCAEYSDSVLGTFGRGCLNIGGQTGMLIYNNVITQNQRPEGFNGWPIKYVNHGYLKNCRIFNNILTKIPYGGNYPGQNGWDFCIELFHIEGLEISGNIIHGSIDLNFSRRGNSEYSAWIHHNVIGRDTVNSKYESGIIFEFGAESAIVEYNTIRNISSGVQFNTRDSSLVSKCRIRKNLMANLASGDGTGTAGGILIVSEGTSSAIIDSMDIDNNTIVATTLTDREPWVGIYLDALNHGAATNIKIRNNIVVGFAGAWLKGSDTTTNIDQLHLLVNNSYNNGNNNLPFWPGGMPTNYVDTPYNVPGLNPMFDSTTGTYTLQSVSPVIDLGVIIPGIAYLGAGPDLGYAEFGGGPPLPVTLIELTGKENGGKNELQWTTATESGSDHFLIERSSDGRYFERIGFMKASGFSSTKQYYGYTDAIPLPGLTYYRLAMVNKDNTAVYSRIISIRNKNIPSVVIKYIELPSGTGNALLLVQSTKNLEAGMSITDMNGRIVLQSRVVLQKGDNSIRLNIPVLARGIYYVRLLTPAETLVKSAISR